MIRLRQSGSVKTNPQAGTPCGTAVRGRLTQHRYLLKDSLYIQSQTRIGSMEFCAIALITPAILN